MVALNKQNLLVEAEKFRSSKELSEYIKTFGIDYDIVKEKCLDIREPITTVEQAEKFAKFCQHYWDALPDRSSIRYGAFFTLCDFGEYYCFGGDDGEQDYENEEEGISESAPDSELQQYEDKRAL